MDQAQIATLFRKYTANRCTAQEIRLLFGAFRDAENEALFRKLIGEHWQRPAEGQKDGLYEEQMRRAFARTDERLREMLGELPEKAAPGQKTIPFRWVRYAAACAALLAGALVYFKLENKTLPSPVEQHPNPQSSLTFADGGTVRIDTAFLGPRELYSARGIALVQDSAEYIKVTGTGLDSLALRPVTLNVAGSRQMKVRLPDGSVVTVNAGSTLSFPLAFGSSSRGVELRGEAYFEVETDKSRPFFVKTEDHLVQVRGTRFNVRSYPEEEKSTTTLLQGSVSVRRLERGQIREEYVLKPGEKIVIAKADPPSRAPVVKEDNPVAWTQGLFSYNNAPMEDILRDFSRWYNVRVDWENIPDLRFQGSIPKNYPLEKAVDLLRRTSGAAIELADNRITFAK